MQKEVSENGFSTGMIQNVDVSEVVKKNEARDTTAALPRALNVLFCEERGAHEHKTTPGHLGQEPSITAK